MRPEPCGAFPPPGHAIAPSAITILVAAGPSPQPPDAVTPRGALDPDPVITPAPSASPPPPGTAARLLRGALLRGGASAAPMQAAAIVRRPDAEPDVRAGLSPAAETRGRTARAGTVAGGADSLLGMPAGREEPAGRGEAGRGACSPAWMDTEESTGTDSDMDCTMADSDAGTLARGGGEERKRKGVRACSLTRARAYLVTYVYVSRARMCVCGWSGACVRACVRVPVRVFINPSRERE